MSLFEFDKNGICHQLTKEAKEIKFTITIEKTIKAEDIENIITTGLEGGIGYWACLLNIGKDWDNEPEDIPCSQYATELLLLGKPLHFADAEGDDDDEVVWELTIDKLLSGIKQNAEERPQDCDLDNIDSTTADCIIQYALFGEVVYG